MGIAPFDSRLFNTAPASSLAATAAYQAARGSHDLRSLLPDHGVRASLPPPPPPATGRASASYTYNKFDNYRLRIPSTKKNKDWAIGDLRVPDGDVSACKEQCDQDDRCMLFNHNRENKRCWFKAAYHDNDQGIGEWIQHDDFDAYEKATD